MKICFTKTTKQNKKKPPKKGKKNPLVEVESRTFDEYGQGVSLLRNDN